MPNTDRTADDANAAERLAQRIRTHLEWRDPLTLTLADLREVAGWLSPGQAAEQTRRAVAEALEKAAGPYRCCPHCADDSVHDVEPDQHTVRCQVCDSDTVAAARAHERASVLAEVDRRLRALIASPGPAALRIVDDLRAPGGSAR